MLASSVTRCWNKISPIFPEFVQKVARGSLFKCYVFQNRPKSFKLFGLLLDEILLPKMLKNSTIWSHCSCQLVL